MDVTPDLAPKLKVRAVMRPLEQILFPTPLSAAHFCVWAVERKGQNACRGISKYRVGGASGNGQIGWRAMKARCFSLSESEKSAMRRL